MSMEPDAQWDAQFERLGASKVRAALLASKWSADKRDAARAWVETRDAHAWQAQRNEDEGQGSLILTFRRIKWWRYVAPALVILGGLRIAFRIFRHY